MARRRESRTPLLAALLLALLVHVPLGWWFLKNTFLDDSIPEAPSRPVQVTILNVAPPEEEPEEEEPEEEEAPKPKQVVDIAKPKERVKPEEADFLAEYDNQVDEQTVDPRYRLDREVTAETYSPDDAYELEGQQDLEQPLPSTGAIAGRELFKSGRYSLFPNRESMWDRGNEAGLDLPMASSHSSERIAGAPSNDYLPEVDKADKTALNSHEFLFAAYINRVSALISFYANQTLQNARPRVPLVNSKYTVGLELQIDPQGGVDALSVIRPSGVPAFDDAMRQAVNLASPFPEPPTDGLIDGAFPMGFSMTIPLGRARADLSGIDPRAGVQFPGLERVPR